MVCFPFFSSFAFSSRSDSALLPLPTDNAQNRTTVFGGKHGAHRTPYRSSTDFRSGVSGARLYGTKLSIWRQENEQTRKQGSRETSARRHSPSVVLYTNPTKASGASDGSFRLGVQSGKDMSKANDATLTTPVTAIVSVPAINRLHGGTVCASIPYCLFHYRYSRSGNG